MRERLIRFLEGSFAGRCVYRFLELEGLDRALALSSRAFVAVVPLAVVATALTPVDDDVVPAGDESKWESPPF